ncbi:MAG: FapA family protein [bacterium]|nr:FapA family protein [bacterium]
MAKDMMSATVVFRLHGEDEPPITEETILADINEAKIVFGIDRAAIKEAVEGEQFGRAITIARGVKPTRGEASSLEYHFRTSLDLYPREDERGNLDYKDIHFIQNIARGELLVSKIPATEGLPGTTIFGNEIAPKPGIDTPLKGGNNTTVSEDGLSLTAAVDGAIMYANGIVGVNDITVINGNVDFGVGNITCRTSVQVKGGVKSGFSIKTSGDIEIDGTAEDCNLVAGGNILVKEGIIGNERGEIRADGNITAKFVENHCLLAGGEITIGEEIVNSRLEADLQIVVQGQQGRIIGGSCTAGKVIKVAVAGSESETATLFEIKLDPDLVTAYAWTESELQRLITDRDRIQKALTDLYQQKAKEQLTFQERKAMSKLERTKENIPVRIHELEIRKEDLTAQLAKIEGSHIEVLEHVHPGVTVRFGLAEQTILEGRAGCRFEFVDNEVLYKSLSQPD